jgi:hypothetical protein
MAMLFHSKSRELDITLGLANASSSSQRAHPRSLRGVATQTQEELPKYTLQLCRDPGPISPSLASARDSPLMTKRREIVRSDPMAEEEERRIIGIR